MKTVFLLCMLVLCFITKAQDCYNGGNVNLQNEDSAPTENIKPSKENTLLLMPYVMKEKEVVSIMKQKNHSELNSLLKKAERNKRLQYLGFLGIPSGFIGAACVVSVNMFGPPRNKADVQQENIGSALIALAPLCLSSAIYFKSQRTKNYKKAIAKYNQVYN